MDRRAAFSYRCAACSRCCHHKKIQLNPYELARLARAQDLDAAAFRERYVTDHVYLRQKADGACVFLGEQGCTVHADRPLVCRLYPLGRIVDGEGEKFVELTPHPQTEGIYGSDGTIGEYLATQGADPFMQAADAYYQLFRWVARLSGDGGPDSVSDQSGILEALDLEAFVAREAARRNVDLPEPLGEQARLHCIWLAEMITDAQHEQKFTPQS
jgi:Fe-S-cluster containining protein